MLKKAAAQVNLDLNLLDKSRADAIMQACDEILADASWSLDQFPVDIYQTGSGTSTNMNVNEVIASRANELLGHPRRPIIPQPPANEPTGAPGGSPVLARTGATAPSVHPNDHVNMGQSSNDTVPTSIHLMALIMFSTKLDPAMELLYRSLKKKSRSSGP